MFNVDIDNTQIVEQQQLLEKALSTNVSTERVLRKLIRSEILAARKKVVADAKLKNDPRGARQAVRTSVYKKILGANINIFSSRRSHTPNSYEPPRKLKPGQWGGNRRKRSARTNTVMHYGPLDRGFILRFQNSGTGNRSIQPSGNRGSLSAKNFSLRLPTACLPKPPTTSPGLSRPNFQKFLTTKNKPRYGRINS